MEWLIYGANGYTGELVARAAVARGLHPILAGRSAAAVAALAEELGLEYRVVDLTEATALRAALGGVRVVAHCAGPFSTTSAPMVDACLAAGAHYLDITGEVGVFERIFERHADAAEAGVVLLPGAGFDVVPTDCLAVLLHTALPSATRLELAFLTTAGMSRGTLRTGIEGLATGNLRRVGGALVPTPMGQPSRTVPFPRSGPRTVGAIRWGDLASGYRSTGIPNITTYTVLPAQRGLARPIRAGLTRLISMRPVRAAAGRLVLRRVTGPDAARRAASRCEVWAQVSDDRGEVHTATLTGPNPYDLTADAVVRAAGYLLAGVGPAGRVEPGAHTPATAFGAGFVTLLDGVTVTGSTPG